MAQSLHGLDASDRIATAGALESNATSTVVPRLGVPCSVFNLLEQWCGHGQGVYREDQYSDVFVKPGSCM